MALKMPNPRHRNTIVTIEEHLNTMATSPVPAPIPPPATAPKVAEHSPSRLKPDWHKLGTSVIVIAASDRRHCRDYWQLARASRTAFASPNRQRVRRISATNPATAFRPDFHEERSLSRFNGTNTDSRHHHTCSSPRSCRVRPAKPGSTNETRRGKGFTLAHLIREMKR